MKTIWVQDADAPPKCEYRTGTIPGSTWRTGKPVFCGEPATTVIMRTSSDGGRSYVAAPLFRCDAHAALVGQKESRMFVVYGGITG